jgi:PAS domain S-box-containing protein
MTQELEELRIAWLGLKTRVDQLATERQQYLEFFENAAEAYVVTAPDGCIVEANGAAVDVLQRRKNYLRGKPLVVFVALDRRAEFRDRLARIGTERSWRTVFATGGERFEVGLTARVIEQPGGGICWRLERVQ